jgi:threonyl-tRNA synthetase
MLQRIYGTVWSSQEELDQFLWRRAEAKKRDHRRLGLQLDLFSVPRRVTGGGAFWHPKGWRLYNTLRDAMREIQAKRGYQEIYTPPLVHPEAVAAVGPLGSVSRHDVPGRGRRAGSTASSPMNCPESTFIYRARRCAHIRDFPVAADGVRGAAPVRVVGR